ncbi:MAG: hypothetical protein AB1502_04735 [Thermodesulfobacteriota bacterium]
MQRYLRLMGMVGHILFLLVFSASAQEHVTKRIERIEAFDRDWVEDIVLLPMDKTPIEKYYSQKTGKSSSYIGRIVVSPVGDRIAFSVNNDSIWVVRRDGTGLRCITQGLDNVHSPYWSIDGKTITFIKGGNERNYAEGTIMQVTQDGAYKKIIGAYDLREPGNRLFPPWMYSPDGKYLLRSSGKPLDYNRYVVRVKDQKVVAIYKTGGSTLEELWFPNGKEVLIEGFLGHGESELVVFSLTGKYMTILPKGRMNLEPTIHPSGALIAYFDDYERELHFLTKDGSKNQLILKTTPTVYIGDMNWTSQGDLAFDLRDQIYFLKLKKQVP